MDNSAGLRLQNGREVALLLHLMLLNSMTTLQRTLKITQLLQGSLLAGTSLLLLSPTDV